jgi:hypothetical protein
MSRWLLVAMLLAGLSVVEPAFAELLGVANGRPAFSESDRTIIARNRLLATILDQDPWLVRRALDSLALADTQQQKDIGKLPPLPPRTPATPTDDDLRDNPDLEQMQKALPEAAHDLFQLLKQAGAKRPNN